VWPIGPEFHDPVNAAPYVVAVSPALGSVTEVPEFHIQFGDADLDDTLVVRFLADYPPYSGDTRWIGEIVLPPGGRAERNEVSFSPDCERHALEPSLDVHRIHVAVSDRGWRASENVSEEELPWRFTIPKVRGNVVESQWLLSIKCP